MKDYTEITKLSDACLLSEVKATAGRELDATVELLLYLAELERRKLHLAEGFSSLFDFCTRKLKFSEGAAQRRICSARAAAKHPELLELLRAREISLCTLSMASNLLTGDNYPEIVNCIRHKSRREAEALLSAYKGAPLQRRESVKARSVPAGNQSEAGQQQDSEQKQSGPETTQFGAATATGGGGHEGRQNQSLLLTTGESDPQREQQQRVMRYELRFEVSEEQFEQFKEVKALLGGKFPEGASIEQIFGELVESYLQRHCPQQREARRQKRLEKQQQRQAALPSAAPEPQATTAPSPPSRRVPQALHDRVWLQDGGRCTYVGPDGTRCTSRHDLEIHHLVPWSRSGEHKLDGLTLRCRAHNLLEAEKDFGTHKIRAAIGLRS